MALIKFNDYVPVRFNSLVDELLNDAFTNENGEKVYKPSADILENDISFEINLTLPGIAKSDIELNVDEGVLKVTASRPTTGEDDKESVKYHLRETVYGSYARSFKLPENVKDDKIKANLEHGILTITIPKDKQKPLKRTITIG